MKVSRILIGLVTALVVLAGGVTTGTFITQALGSDESGLPAGQPIIVPQQELQATVVPPQSLGSQATPLPPQEPWGPGRRMMNPYYVPQGEWQCGRMSLAPGANSGVNPNLAPQDQPGPGRCDWDDDNWYGMHDGMMNGYGWQTNPNWAGMPGGMMNGYGWQSDPDWKPYPNVPNRLQNYPTPSTPVSFKDDVQPIFAESCVSCHGGIDGLYLDTYENIIKGGSTGAVIVPGDVSNSRLAHYVYNGYMPFRNPPLDSTQAQTILDWIAAGAPNN